MALCRPSPMVVALAMLALLPRGCRGALGAAGGVSRAAVGGAGTELQALPSARRLFTLDSLLGIEEETTSTTTLTATTTVPQTTPQVLLPSMMNPVVFPSAAPSTTTTDTTTTTPPAPTTTTPKTTSTSVATTTTAATTRANAPSAALASAAPGAASSSAPRDGDPNGGAKIEDGQAASEAASTQASTRPVTTTTVVPASDFATCKLHILNVSYLGLISNLSLLYRFEAALKSALAEAASNETYDGDVGLKLYAGSVVASATIAARHRDHASEIQTRLNSSTTLDDIVLARLNSIAGLDSVLLGHIGISEIFAPLLSRTSPSPSFFGALMASPWFLASLALTLALLSGLGFFAYAHRSRKPGKTRGVELEGEHEGMLLVSDETPRTVRSSSTACTPRSEPSAAETPDGSEMGQAQQERRGLLSKLTSSLGARGNKYSALSSNDLDLVTVSNGGIHVQPLRSGAPLVGVPVVYFRSPHAPDYGRAVGP
mmetsp:Transcript_88707/g.231558  ORF Transcript_88707/g.231558 Transcript_88707/m.231558 type:complete len:487 (+) Transcript_88707:51-1511(+)